MNLVIKAGEMQSTLSLGHRHHSLALSVCSSQCTVLADLERLLLHNRDSYFDCPTKPGAHP
jgi:hypothetical protein